MIKDSVEAVKWTRKAAEQGYARAQKNLGVYYGNGEGVAKDYVKAYIWLSIAYGGGHTSASEPRDQLEQILTPAQLTEAKRQVQEWQEKHQKADGK